MKLADNDYLILTPAGVLHAFSYIEANEKQQALQALLPSQHVSTANDWVQRYGAIWLKQFIDEGWVEIIDKRLIAPTVSLDTFLPYVVASLSGKRRAAIGSHEGFCLARIGFTQKEADIVCVVAADFVEFLKRQQQRGWFVEGQGISFLSNIDMIMPTTTFIFLWINEAGYWLILEGEPLLNNRAFVELVWGLKVAGERFIKF